MEFYLRNCQNSQNALENRNVNLDLRIFSQKQTNFVEELKVSCAKLSKLIQCRANQWVLRLIPESTFVIIGIFFPFVCLMVCRFLK